MLRSLESVQNHEERVALDAAARLIAILRYDAPGDPIQAIDALDKAMRRLARV